MTDGAAAGDAGANSTPAIESFANDSAGAASLIESVSRAGFELG